MRPAAVTVKTKEVIKMLNFFIDLILGTFLGVLIMCLCNVASKADDDMEKMFENEKRNDKNE